MIGHVWNATKGEAATIIAGTLAILAIALSLYSILGKPVGEIPLVGGHTISPVASIEPAIKTASMICSDPAAQHFHVVSQFADQWVVVLDVPLADEDGRQILDPAGAPIITRYRAIVTQGGDGLSADVALFHSTTGKLENPSSEPNTPAITECIKRGATKVQAAP